MLQNDHIEKLKERNAYLERKDEAYMRMKEEVEDTQKRLETVATGTVAMASDLVDAREASIRNEEFAKALLEQQASTSENEMRMLEHHISVANAALEQISGTLIFVCVRARVFLTKLVRDPDHWARAQQFPTVYYRKWKRVERYQKGLPHYLEQQQRIALELRMWLALVHLLGKTRARVEMP